MSCIECCAQVRMEAWKWTQPSSEVLFCTHCHSLLSPSSISKKVDCRVCGASHLLKDLLLAVSVSTRNLSSSSSRQRHETVGSSSAKATVEEQCPKCPNRVLWFYTMQLRSADEGQTVFYECTACRHKWSLNN